MICGKCGRVHLAWDGKPGCAGHRSGYRDPVTGERVMFPKDQQPPCRKHPMPGIDKCDTHGGLSPQAKAKAARRRAERKARALAMRWGVPVEISGVDAVIGQVHLWAGLELFYREQVALLDPARMVWGKTRKKTGGDDRGTTHAAGEHAWIGLHREASKMLVHCAAAAISAGIEERRVRLAEQQGQLVAEAIRRILDDLGLTPEQAGKVAQVVPRHLRLLTGTG